MNLENQKQKVNIQWFIDNQDKINMKAYGEKYKNSKETDSMIIQEFIEGKILLVTPIILEVNSIIYVTNNNFIHTLNLILDFINSKTNCTNWFKSTYEPDNKVNIFFQDLTQEQKENVLNAEFDIFYIVETVEEIRNKINNYNGDNISTINPIMIYREIVKHQKIKL